MENKLYYLNSNSSITSNPLHSDTSISLVSSIINPQEDTITNLIINDNIQGNSK